MQNPRVLIIDDERNFREFLGEALESEGYQVSHAATARAGLALARRDPPQVVLLDQNLPDGSGLNLLPELRSQSVNPVVIVITAFPQYPYAVEAVKAGAFHYLSKPFEFGGLLEILREAAVVTREGTDDMQEDALAELVGTSPRMIELKHRVTRLARSPVETILLRGESGTGKELVARAIHALSTRGQRRMLAVNCAALSETLLFTELFGHEKGAFTDAREQKQGVFEAANGGTLFLDEISEMGHQAQAALLRVLEQRTVRRVGGTEDIPVDLRVIAATNRDLSGEVEKERFRLDLYHRLHVVDLTVPPLRERGEDVVQLTHHFAEQMALRFREPARLLDPEIAHRLRGYPWPGNVRELRNAVERAYALGVGPSLGWEDLGIGATAPSGDLSTGSTAADVSFQDAKQQMVDHFERRYLEELMARSEGNITRAAEEARMIRQVLQRLLKRHGIEPERFRD